MQNEVERLGDHMIEQEGKLKEAKKAGLDLLQQLKDTDQEINMLKIKLKHL